MSTAKQIIVKIRRVILVSLFIIITLGMSSCGSRSYTGKWYVTKYEDETEYLELYKDGNGIYTPDNLAITYETTNDGVTIFTPWGEAKKYVVIEKSGYRCLVDEADYNEVVAGEEMPEFCSSMIGVTTENTLDAARIDERRRKAEEEKINDEKQKIISLVKGNIEAVYLGEALDEYVQIVGTTPQIIEGEYLDGLAIEGEFFCHYFNIIDPSYGETFEKDVSDEVKQLIVNMYAEVYSKLKYDVGEPEKQDERSYIARIEIYPIDVMEMAIASLNEGSFEPYNEFLAKYGDIDFEKMTDDEFEKTYKQYNNDYASVIISCVNSFIAESGYKNPVYLSIRIEKNDEYAYIINDDDWSLIDENIIYYP